MLSLSGLCSMPFTPACDNSRSLLYFALKCLSFSPVLWPPSLCSASSSASLRQNVASALSRQMASSNWWGELPNNLWMTLSSPCLFFYFFYFSLLVLAPGSFVKLWTCGRFFFFTQLLYCCLNCRYFLETFFCPDWSLLVCLLSSRYRTTKDIALPFRVIPACSGNRTHAVGDQGCCQV